MRSINDLTPYLSVSQRMAICSGATGEEGAFFKKKIHEIALQVETMPAIYAQEGMGDAAKAHLHYFLGGSDWYITERNVCDQQVEAFGFVILNGDLDNAEMGYLSLKEILQYGAELDLDWVPTSLRDVKEKHGLEVEPKPAEVKRRRMR